MAIGTWVGGTLSESVGGSTVPGIPAGASEGELLVLIDRVVHTTRTAGAATTGTPAGWVEKDSYLSTGSGKSRTTLYYRRWTSGVGAPTVTYSGGGSAAHTSRIYRVPGAISTGDPTDFVTGGTWGASSSAGPIPGGTTSVDGGAVLVAAQREDASSASPSSAATLTGDSLTWVELTDTDFSTGDDSWSVTNYALVPTARTITAKTFTMTASPGNYPGSGVMWALLPEPTATAPTVSAGADVAGHPVGTEFTRTGTVVSDGGSAVTAHQWQIVAGPASVGATGSTQGFAYTPTVVGAYTFRYSATNAAGTSAPDDMVLTVVDPAPVEHSGSDSGTGTEAGSVTWLLDGSDSGTGFETGFVAENRDGLDAGTGSETGALSSTTTGGDSGTGADAAGIDAAIEGTDSGSGADTGHIAIPGTDSGAGSATLTGLSASTASGDVGSGTEGGYVETLFADLVISLFGIHPDTGALVPLPDFTKLTLSPVRNSAGSISVDYPPTGLNFALLRDTITDDRDLEIEIWSFGMSDGALRGYLQEASGDDVAEGGDWAFSGGFLELRMAKALVWPQPKGAILPDDDDDPTNDEHANEKQELMFAAVTPGTIAATILAQAQGRGALTDIGRDFTTTTDSGGTPWPSVLSTKYSPGATYEQVLTRLVDIGLAEWSVEWTGSERVLRLWVPEGRGTDLTIGDRPVVLRHGRNLIDAPRKWSVRDSGTAVLAVGGEGVYQTASDASALARRGRRIEVAVSANNLDNPGAVLAYAQAQLALTTKGLHEVTHGIGFLPGEPRPILAYDVGDWVYSQTRASMDRLRIVQWTLTVDAGSNPSGTVTLNDTVQDALERLQRRLDSLTAGETVVGTSESSSIDDVMAPSAPTGLTISSIAYQDSEHSQTLAAVTIGWAPVTTDAAGPSTERAQAAQLILERMQSGLPIFEDWTWVGAPPIVGVHNDALLGLYADSGSTNPQTWLAGYVSANSSGSVATDDVAGYKVQLAYLGLSQVGGLPYANPVDQVISYNDVTPSNGIPQTSYTFGGVEAGANIGVRVAAFDSSGNQSAWSTPIGHDTETDNVAPPIPSTPTARNFLRQLIVGWDGLGSVGEVMPRDFDYVEVHASMASTFTATAATVFERMYGEGGVVYDPGSYVGTVYFTLVSVDRSGNRSVASAQASATPSRAIADDVGDQIIGAAKLADGAVIGPKIAPEAVSTPHLSVATFSDNLLPNGGFEDVALTGGLPASWVQATSSGGTNAYTRTTNAADVFSGAAAVQVVMSAASGRLDIASDSLPTKPGDNWYFELSAKASRALAGVTVYVGVGTVDQPTVAYPTGWVYPFLGTPALTTAYPGAPLGFNYTVPATVGAGVIPKYLRLYLYFGNVAGDATAVTFHVDEVRARKVVGTAEIQDAAISRAKIGLLQVGDGQFESASVGKLLTGTMTATVTNSGLFRTAATGNRVEFDSAGLRLYMGSTVVGRWSTTDASMLMTGTYMSSLSGERINILTDGTMRFYPPSGINYAQIRNDGNQVTFRGPSDVNGRSGYIGFNAIGAGMAFAADSEIPNNLRSEIVLFDRRARITAPLVDFQLDGKEVNPNGGHRRFTFSQTSENGVFLPITAVSYRAASSGHGGFEGNDAGLKFIDGHLEVVDGPMNAFRAIFASAFSVASSETVKEDIRDVRADLDPLAVIRGARSKRWTYTWERWRTPVPTEDDPTPGRVEVEPPVHFGPIAEDLPPILQVPISNPMGPGKTLGVSLGDQIGVLWAAIGQMEDQQTRSVTGRGVVTSGQLRAGDTVRVAVLWDETPLATPTDVTALALPSAPTATGRVSAHVDPATVTTGGCEVVLSVSGTIPVVATAALPIGVEVIGRYLYRPPYIPGEEAA